MGNFIDIFAIGPSADEPPEEPTFVQPDWMGPPEDELGVCVPQSLVLGRSERGVVALRHAISYSKGVTLDLVAAGRGLRDRDTNKLFHEQHLADPEDDLPAGFLRLGIELPDGSRVSNLADRRRLWRPDREAPEGPLLIEHGGGGGSAGSGRIRMNPAYWLWPLPPSGTLRLFVEWPALEISLTSTELDAAPIVRAAAASRQLWA
jgi:hypothetical protein